MKASNTKIGIIGHGSFGQFTAKTLAPYADIYIYDTTEPTSLPVGVHTSFEDLKSMDCIILAVPLGAYRQVLTDLKPILRSDTLVVDICSVKTQSRDIVRDVLGDHPNTLICHPLFGPQSAASSTVGHDIIVTDATGDLARAAIVFFSDTLKLNVHHISAEDHDKIMAYVHVLTFFVARGLSDMPRPDIPFQTPSYNLLTALINFNQKHSQDLFVTIQEGNPYADEVRQELIKTFQNLEQSIINKELHS